MKVKLRIEGMTCNNCVRHVRNALSRVPRVISAHVDLEKSQAVVTAEEGCQPSQLIGAVEEAGYGAKLIEGEDEDSASKRWTRSLVLGIILTTALYLSQFLIRSPPLWLGNILFALSIPSSWMTLLYSQWNFFFGLYLFLLALPVQLVSGYSFYLGAYRQIRSGRLDMDTLVSLGSSSAFLLSTFGLFFPGIIEHYYYDEAAAIITLVSAGHWLEARVSRRANRTLKKLLELAPAYATVLEDNGIEKKVPVSELVIGQRVVLKPGERIPVDGEVIEGQGLVDESMLTGESRPIEKFPAEKVFAGTLNLNSRIVMRVSAAGEKTVLAHIAEVVLKAQESRASIQNFVDKLSSVFVIFVIGIAIATALGWGFSTKWETALIRAASVLVVACPCAMGLATPAAIMVASNRLASLGILIRDGSALEKCGKIREVIFDKTGTLTQPKLTVGDPEYFLKDPLLANSLAYSLAKSSLHPVSRAVIEKFENYPLLSLEHWQEKPGAGIQALYQDHVVRLGSLSWLKSLGINIDELKLQSLSGIGLAMDDSLVAYYPVSAPLKPAAKKVIERLSANGYIVYILSGDKKEIALELGAQIGINSENIIAEVRPEEKAKVVRSLQQQGKSVAFIGDGINDGPALAQADLGIAVLNASDIAKESADIVLLNADIEIIPLLLEISDKTLKTIKENLFWAFFYNTLAIPLAVMGKLSPSVCAAAMGLSDLFVIGNALRLYKR
ncbi:heavy metal translocating P-type ATPase [Methylacidiphilum caldifontis]|uniref:ATPase n=1 Tax=Methylacidiphilum caldifontis TaxID=2795386 RepID=A0A4Y8PE34_9BACT|nr:cation-translocating P-type ATPase [Methylacidiphilum caldifontis]QSR88690.1 cadmium-translocating P-type ATPase [Methylacidiphilum caldifontis]TFE68430.1 ATPase [Methylacidiphilum caldifontis]